MFFFSGGKTRLVNVVVAGNVREIREGSAGLDCPHHRCLGQSL